MVNMKTTVIACYNLDGRLVRTYISARKAASSIHVYYRSIDKAIREGNIIHDKQWKRFSSDNVPDSIEPYQKKTTVLSIRPVGEIDDNNIVIRAYPSVKKAAESINVDPHTLRDVLSGKRELVKGKKYRYLFEEEIEKYGYQKGREISVKKVAIIQLDLSGKYIATYKSIYEALIYLGYPNRSQEIKDCLSGKYSTAFGYIWKYKDKDNVVRNKKPLIIKLDPNSKKVIKKYRSVKEAAKDNNLSASAINNCIRGINKTSGGYLWKRQ